MELRLDDKFKIISNQHAYTLKKEVAKRKSGSPVYQELGYYTTIESALNGYIDHSVKANDNIKTIQDLAQYIKSLKQGVSKALQPLKLGIRDLN